MSLRRNPAQSGRWILPSSDEVESIISDADTDAEDDIEGTICMYRNRPMSARLCAVRPRTESKIHVPSAINPVMASCHFGFEVKAMVLVDKDFEQVPAPQFCAGCVRARPSIFSDEVVAKFVAESQRAKLLAREKKKATVVRPGC